MVTNICHRNGNCHVLFLESISVSEDWHGEAGRRRHARTRRNECAYLTRGMAKLRELERPQAVGEDSQMELWCFVEKDTHYQWASGDRQTWDTCTLTALCTCPFHQSLPLAEFSDKPEWIWEREQRLSHSVCVSVCLGACMEAHSKISTLVGIPNPSQPKVKCLTLII